MGRNKEQLLKQFNGDEEALREYMRGLARRSHEVVRNPDNNVWRKHPELQAEASRRGVAARAKKKEMV